MKTVRKCAHFGAKYKNKALKTRDPCHIDRQANEIRRSSGRKKAAVKQNAFIVEILYDPIFDSLRDDPRFPEVIRRIGLP